MKGYHFTGSALRDGRPLPAIGEALRHEGDIKLCDIGLHASRHVYDALIYAPGSMLHRVELRGDLKHGRDKVVGRERTILASIDATELLRVFARRCALDVIHLWDAPDVVRQYLASGDESMRLAASRAAAADDSYASDSAASAAYRSVHAAARDAAWAAARDAVRAAARDAAKAKHRRRLARMVNAAFRSTTDKGDENEQDF